MTRATLISSAIVVLALVASAVPWAAAAEYGEADPGSETEVETETDSPDARREAMDAWYNDTEGKSARNRSKRGRFSREYMRFLNDVAEGERYRWRELMPTAKTSQTSGSAYTTQVAATGNTWLPIGPTKADKITNGAITLTGITDAGRVSSIVPVPNSDTLYVAFSGGGVWKTSAASVAVPSWTPLTDALGSLSVGSLAIDPVNPNTLYLGLGDPFDGTGIGLVKSTDAGATWTKPVYLGRSREIPQLAVASTNPAIVLAGTDRGLFRSVDAGATFTKVLLSTGRTVDPYVWSIAATGGQGFVMALEANPYATSGTTDGQVWKSSDNGTTWTRATGVSKTGGVGRVTVAAASGSGINGSTTVVYALAAVPKATAAADLADIFKSTDGGATFTALGAAARTYTNSNSESTSFSTLLNGQGWYNQMIIVDPANANTVYTGGNLLTARTTDGFARVTQTSNWLRQFSLGYVHADIHTAAFSSTRKLFVGSDGGIFRADNPTATPPTWVNLNEGINTLLTMSVGSSKNNIYAVVAGMQDNGTRVRVSNTSVFNQILGGDGFGSDVNASNAALMLGTMGYARVFRSTNGGASFSQSCSGITECNNSSAAPFITHIASWSGDATGNTVYTTSNTKVYKSTTYASSWTALGTSGLTTTPPGGTLTIRNVSASHKDRVGCADPKGCRVGVITSGGRVFVTDNAGISWTQIGKSNSNQLASNPDGSAAAVIPGNEMSLSSLHFDRVNPGTIYLSSVAPSATAEHLWKTVDNGASWVAIDGNGLPAGVPVNVITSDPGDANTLYAGTHLGVYRSQDAGASWARFGAGLPMVNVTDIYISDDSSLVRVATYGRGIWELAPGTAATR